jgi:predicted RNA methylase
MNSVGLNRDFTDKFYTKKEVVEYCIENIKKYILIDYEKDLIIEPSAGNGAFINSIKVLSKNNIFYDLYPEDEQIIKKDFLSIDIIRNENGKIHAIGNPPFGKQSSLAIKFIKKLCTFCDTISLILPKSFKKDSLKKYFSRNYHLITELNLPYKSFLIKDKEHDVPCIFQIWEKRNYERELKDKLIPTNFTFVKKEENPHISFRRVGVNAGKIDLNISNKNIQSHYFIKFKDNSLLNDYIVKLSNINYEHDNTVAAKSISKQEIIQKFNEII